MVIATMKLCEMYEDLAADLPRIEYKHQQLRPKAVKKFRKALRFPVWELYEYTSPRSHNTYILYFYASGRQVAENPEFDIFSVFNGGSKRYFLKWGCSPYKHTDSDSFIMTRRVDAYSIHFFTRYRERILRNTVLGINEVICRYFTRNKTSFPIELNEDIKKNYKKYGESANHAMRVHDGLCFVRTAVETHFDPDTQKEVADAIGFLFETFVDDDTLTDIQKEATFNEGIRYSQKLFKDLIADMGEK